MAETILTPLPAMGFYSMYTMEVTNVNAIVCFELISIPCLFWYPVSP